MKDQKELTVYKEGINLVKDVYQLAEKFPREERYELASQLKRATVSIPANISEGGARQHKKEFIQFLFIAKGSASEAETHLFIAKELGFISKEDHDKTYEKIKYISRMLHNLIRSLKK